ncbi:Gfo/Idh/MocA family protein [Proteiniphilum sp. UBA5384]|uniref:Gfo/Idh/MocA family protein n=1 Tax=Proteiniphilum sp. UBA5384 TaxID=1947279 RepID=UPI0025CC0268|nr:Gfo/Idh/MocA family oxidoreductase [Proteiniphilum sp. UBA5384]
MIGNNNSKRVNRRAFVKHTLAGVIVTAFGGTLSGFTAKSYARIIGANERISVAIVGVNNRGRALAVNFAHQRNCRVTHITDVDFRAIKKCIAAVTAVNGETPHGEADFRRLLDDKSVDALVMATPDHWHTPGTLLALRAGKHVYIEKPVSTTPHEGDLLRKASSKYPDIVIQVGTQRRSWPNIVTAIQEIHDGVIGRPYFGKGWYANNRRPIGIGKEVAVPSWLDYELWQGPATRKPYKDNLIHYNWHWFWHYGHGELPGNGIHILDLLRWGMQVDYPIRISSIGGRYQYEDDWETPDTQTVDIEFADNKSMCWEGRSCNGVPLYNYPVGAMFYGENGSLLIGQGNEYKVFDLKGKIVKEVKSEFTADPMNRTNPSQQLDALHIQNFFSAIREGSQLRSDIEDNYKSTLLCQLGNIAYRTGTMLQIDPASGAIIGNQEAMGLWTKEYHPEFEPEI